MYRLGVAAIWLCVTAAMWARSPSARVSGPRKAIQIYFESGIFSPWLFQLPGVSPRP